MNKTNLSAYMAMTVSQLKEEQRMGTAHVYQSTLNRIKDFMEQDSISFEEVTPVWLKAFQEYELENVNLAAGIYTEQLKEIVKTPIVPKG